MSRGLSEEDARAMIVSGFADNVSKELPLEYAVEMNNLIQLEMKAVSDKEDIMVDNKDLTVNFFRHPLGTDWE